MIIPFKVAQRKALVVTLATLAKSGALITAAEDINKAFGDFERMRDR